MTHDSECTLTVTDEAASPPLVRFGPPPRMVSRRTFVRGLGKVVVTVASIEMVSLVPLLAGCGDKKDECRRDCKDDCTSGCVRSCTDDCTGSSVSSCATEISCGEPMASTGCTEQEIVDWFAANGCTDQALMDQQCAMYCMQMALIAEQQQQYCAQQATDCSAYCMESEIGYDCSVYCTEQVTGPVCEQSCVDDSTDSGCTMAVTSCCEQVCTSCTGLDVIKCVSPGQGVDGCIICTFADQSTTPNF